MLHDIAKRTIDIVLSIVIMTVFFPVVLLTIIAIKIDSEGPVLADTPSRVGRRGKLFKMYKFRSMVKNAHELLVTNKDFEKLHDEYKKGGYKLKNDPRITRVGKIIRRYSIDELPQCLNVLKGEMSFVGPRAYYPDELRDQQKNYPHTQGLVKVVLSVKPGITGAWQVGGRSEINFDKRIKIDAHYASKRSILYDLYIILKTPYAMLSGKGAM